MKMHRNILVGVITLCITSSASAAIVGQYAASWGSPSVKKCITTFPQEFSIDAAGGFQEKINLLLPRTINENGAEFCPYMAGSYRKNRTERPILRVFYANGKSAADCFWVCKNGWGGHNCSVDYSAGASTCDSVELNIEKISGDTEGTETEFAAFSGEHYDCNNEVNDKRTSDQNNYHYVTLGVEKILPHGAVVRPVTLRAFAERANGDDWNYVLLEPIGSDSHVLCKNGYKPSADGTSCVPINAVLCDNTPICDGWDHEVFQDTQNYKRKNVDGCIQYRCAQSGYGFTGNPTGEDSDRECIECSAEGYYASLGDNGICVLSPLKGGEGVEYDEDGNPVVFELEQTRKRDMTERTYKGKPCWQHLLDGDDAFKKCLVPNKVSVAVDVDKPAISKPEVAAGSWGKTFDASQIPVVKF